MCYQKSIRDVSCYDTDKTMSKSEWMSVQSGQDSHYSLLFAPSKVNARQHKMQAAPGFYCFTLNPSFAEHDMPCLCKQVDPDQLASEEAN